MNNDTTDQNATAADASARIADLLATMRSANDAFEKNAREHASAIESDLHDLEAGVAHAEDELAAYGHDLSSDIGQETARLEAESASIEQEGSADEVR